MQLQAFIFCGRGENLSPFSRANAEDGANSHGLPKAILPIGNRLMIEYVLDWCDQADFREINIVAHAEDVDVIREALTPHMTSRNQQYELFLKSLSSSMHTHYLQKPRPISFISTKAHSTGESLQKELLEKITSDFVLLPCDFVTDIPPQILIDQYRNRDPENIAMTFYYKNTVEITDKKSTGKQFFTVYSNNEDCESQQVLLDIYSKEDVKKSKNLKIRTHLLWKYPEATVSTKLLNSFIYFCSFELCHLLSTKEQMHDKGNREDDENLVSNQSATEIKPSYFKTENELIKDPISCNKSLGKVFRDLARRSWKHSEPRETVGMFILPELGTFIRANHLNAFMEANRFILKIKVHALATNTQTTTASASAIGADAIVGSNCTILEKSNIKLSAVGSDCGIGNRCRVAGSVLFSGVRIEDEVILENCIVGSNAKIGKKSKLTNCYVEGNYTVELRSVLKGETLAKVHFDDSEEDTDNDDIESSSDENDQEYPEEYFHDDDLDDDLFQR